MTIIYLINYSTWLPARLRPVGDYAPEGRAYSSERPEAEIRILFYASAGSSSPSMPSDDSRVSGAAASSTAVSIGFNSRSWGNIGR